MRNHRDHSSLKLLDMMPNAWFYKLKDINGAGGGVTAARRNGKPNKTIGHEVLSCRHHSNTPSHEFTINVSPSLLHHPNTKRQSYHYTKEEIMENQHHTHFDFFPPLDLPRRSRNRTRQSAAAGADREDARDIVLEVTGEDPKADFELKPILTKPTCMKGCSKKTKKKKKASGISRSFALVKSSWDPRKDFMESMMEMVVENELWRSWEDLEDLLTCYISLNSPDFHAIIVEVFQEICLDLNLN